MRHSRRNPLVFDNRFAPEPMKRYPRSRVVASMVAPPRQRAQMERLADSPHTFRVVLMDERPRGRRALMDVSPEELAAYSEPGTITLIVGLADYFVFDAEANLFSAFTYLHRLGDQLVAFGVEDVMEGQAEYGLYRVFKTSSVYIPSRSPSSETLRLAEVLAETRYFGRGLWPRPPVEEYVATHTNSDMARRGVVPATESGYLQCLADWFALSELPAARARRGRGEPWLLFPPRPGEYAAEVERVLVRYADTINEYFPLFAQSLLDDLDGAVYRI